MSHRRSLLFNKNTGVEADSLYLFNDNGDDENNYVDLTPNGMTYPVGGDSIKYALFDSASDGFVAPNNTDFSFQNALGDLPFSIFYWIYPNSVSGSVDVILSKRGLPGGSYNAAHEWWMFFRFSGIYIGMQDTDSSALIQWIKTGIASWNAVWQSHCMTYNGSGSHTGIKFYRNGVIQTPNTNSTTGSYTKMRPNTSLFGIGSNTSGVSAQMRMNKCRVIRRELTASEVLDFHNEGRN